MREQKRHTAEVEFPSCPNCGSSADFTECERCGGDGFIDDDDGSELYDCEIPDFSLCPDCWGTGGYWECLSGRDWCEAHSLDGGRNE